MRLEHSGSEKYQGSFVAELTDRSLEWLPGCERCVHERQDDHGYRETDGFGQDAKRVGVAHALSTFADRVIGGRANDHGVSFG